MKFLTIAYEFVEWQKECDPFWLQRTPCTFSAIRLLSLTTVLLLCSSRRLPRSFSREAQAALIYVLCIFYCACKYVWLCHIDNPDAKAMTRSLLTFPSQMQAASLSSIDPCVALNLYQRTKDLPGTETCMDMVEEGRISISGPCLSSYPHIVTAVDLDEGTLLALKLLPPASQQQKDAAQREKRVVSLLQLDTTPVDSALVPTQIQSVKVSLDHAKSLQLGGDSYDALKMPWYTTSLQQSVTAMHTVKLLHTGLKAANVFVGSSGDWFLGDFGASNLFGDKIRSCTEVTFWIVT